MDTFEYNQDRIDRYLRKAMSESEVIEFEKELTSDTSLNEQYRHTLIASKAMRVEEANARLTALRSHASKKSEQSSFWSSKVKWAVILLLVILCVVAYLWIYTRGSNDNTLKNTISTPEIIDSNSNTTDTMKANMIQDTIIKDTIQSRKNKANNDGYAALAKKLFAIPQNLAMVVRANNDDKIFESIVENYKNGRYAKALNELKNLGGDAPRQQYLMAHCFYQLKDWSKAQSLFYSFVDDTYSDYHQDSKFYLALCYLNQMPKSKEKLESLCEDGIKSSSPYQSQFKQMQLAIK